MVTVRSDPLAAIGPDGELQTEYMRSPMAPQTRCTQPLFKFVLKSHILS